MSPSSILFFSGVFLFVGIQGRPQLPSIPREFQNINFEQYLRNERAMKFQLKCVVYNGPCDTIGKFLKRNIPIYLKTQCKNCDEEQKKLAGKFILFLQANYPKEWDDALEKYGKATYTQEEINDFESELGVKIFRDKTAPTLAPGQKPDVEGLVALAREGLHAALNTKAPLIIGRKGSATTQIVSGVTVPSTGQLSFLNKYTTTTATPTTTKAAATTREAKSSSMPAEETEIVTVTEAATENPTESSP